MMTGQVNELQWYIARDGKQHGPLTDIEMRTFVAHNYLRQTDLIWRPGMAEWLPAPTVFPVVFQPAPAPVATASPSSAAATAAPQTTHTSDFDTDTGTAGRSAGGLLKRLAIAASIVSIIGGGAFAVATYREPLLKFVSGGAKLPVPDAPQVEAPKVAAADTSASTPADATPTPASSTSTATPTVPDAAAAITPTETQVAAVSPVPETPPAPAAPPSIEGSAIDARLQKIPAWAMIKKDFPDWYVGHIAAADKLAADKKPESEIAAHLAQGLVNLRRQNAEKALAASPEKLKRVASTFLAHLKALRAQSVSACYGFISKGETSPAVVQSLEAPEAATAFNAQEAAIFEAIAEGTKSPTQHAAAVKSDYDALIKELNKIGWKEEDLQVFSNPKLLAKREPEQVCKMVQDWFVAHLAVQDKAAQNRLLYETLKPVVSG